jgi:hypothetical protein
LKVRRKARPGEGGVGAQENGHACGEHHQVEGVREAPEGLAAGDEPNKEGAYREEGESVENPPHNVIQDVKTSNGGPPVAV